MMSAIPRILRLWWAVFGWMYWHISPCLAGEVSAKDGRQHWSFQPVRSSRPPSIRQSGWVRNAIDSFVLERLESQDLHPSPEADREAWLRRVSLDLTGLPPDPELIEMLERDGGEESRMRVVDRLLGSPRYGERWAQHWLDVVRYADTHGFEVNTERPNAWPYRDYVIDAFNRDTPYDRFVRDQIAGDTTGDDAATGFLVTASVLLPGQIGADDVSKRLARQDALDEIVVNTSQTFLGLSIGCARCHDHKFDPVTARDYFSMQAMFAGVEYGDRELRSQAALAKQEEISSMSREVKGIDHQLARHEILASPKSKPPRTTDPKLNIESFPPVPARWVKFSIFDVNLHPNLGWIEPCIDELEIFTDEPIPRNVALVEAGTKVTASGSLITTEHKLEHVRDGRHGNSRSWLSDVPGSGWLLFELPSAVGISKIVWSRDRAGGFGDRLATAYTIEAGESPESLVAIANVPPQRPALNASRNLDRFVPTTAQRLRLTILASNNLEPCIDELEVFDTSDRNVALPQHGTRVTVSGSSIAPDRHEPRFLTDGLYGNSRSWMSDEMGKGWVELQFARPTEIERVVWGRDRTGEFLDRAATNYVIEVCDSTGAWRRVADSSDRRPFVAAGEKGRNIFVYGMDAGARAKLEALRARKRHLEGRMDALKRENVAFAGTFRKPDLIRVLHRGDPEQPREEVRPAVPGILGDLVLPSETSEAERRVALARWISSPANPLTARVMANRIWQGHFGTGLVETASDFGRTGAKPSHPELLDWLATEFVRCGWSVKHLHRLIVLSAAYRQSSRNRPEASEKDADVRWYWRYPARRMDAEEIRDSMLAVSGNLNLARFGRGFDFFNLRGGLSGFVPVEVFSEQGSRRMIYAHKVRREREAVFGAFDCPDAGQSAARRRESTTPIQALNLLNSRFTLDQSRDWARRIMARENQPEGQIQQVYRTALGRGASAEEIALALPEVRAHGLEVLCRALFNANEFLHVP